ncbi:hypothetical protein PanWU01x14_336770 [Parasponia andersonii]|uniref:Uncharacterized protein n=1 Tax=Parasponia andersonii TaxID=3476 RepID=A0A2P5AFR6_PARAD|nr:hypothetical protein PanWU01x14_336770 [Parasponia andersonii]
MASKSEIPSNREMEGYVSKSRRRRGEGIFGDTVGYLMRSKDRRRLLQGYEAQKKAVTDDLASLKDQWYQTYGLPNGWKQWNRI